MKTQRLQAAFARKREAEMMRSEKSAAVDRYFTHWGKVTSKFENWTTPEYYEQAEEKLKKSVERKQKEAQLKERQDKLRELLASEKNKFDEELRALRRPKSRNMSVEMMEKLNQNYKTKQDQRRKLELEGKLYGRWRHGVDDESLLYESKSDNQVLAKLNWLDKQIEDQVQREQEEKIANEQTLRLQEEIRKTEQHHKERQKIREKEIKEIRLLQERHMQELKKREQESETLKKEANYLEKAVEHFKAELDEFNDRVGKSDFQDAPKSHNLNKVKMIIRKRSEVFREQLQEDIELLERLDQICCDEEAVGRLRERLQKQHTVEVRNIEHIEGMYESEAKVNLQQCEDAWRQLNYERRMDITNLLKHLQDSYSSKLNDNQCRQKDLIDIRVTHLSSIENSNERLKLLIKEDEESPRALVIETPRSVPEQQQGNNKSRQVKKVSNSFTNLNLDCLGGGSEVCSRPQSARSQVVFTPDSEGRPRFGRKKVAWL